MKRLFSLLASASLLVSSFPAVAISVEQSPTLKEGDLISAIFSDDPDVYIINEYGYKRLFLNPEIFNFYDHLGGFYNVKIVSEEVRDSYGTAGYFRNCEKNDKRVYGVSVEAEDNGTLHWVDVTGDQAIIDDPHFFKKVFCINELEFNWYPKGQEYKSVKEVPSYERKSFGLDRIAICHHETADSSTWVNINVASPSLEAHLNHGDTKGACPGTTPKPTPTKTPTPSPTSTPVAACSVSTSCGKTCSYGGTIYDTVQIGTQCWFRSNLNAGAMVGNLEAPDNTALTPGNPNTVQKWCYDDDADNCNDEGGLYSWAEANALANSCNASSCSVPSVNQGICPSGWHVPSDSEFYTLENSLTSSGQSCGATRDGWDCSGAGTKLRDGGSSDFDAIGAGNHETNGSLSQYDRREPSIHFWTSTPCPNCSDWGHAISRYMTSSANDPLFGRGWSHNEHGFSVRCISNSSTVPTATPAPASLVQDDFDSYSDGNLWNQGGWSDVVNGESFDVQSATTHDGAKAVMHDYHDGPAIITKSASDLSDGRQSLYFKTVNRSGWTANDDGNVQIRITDGAFEPNLSNPYSGGASMNDPANHPESFIAVTLKKGGDITYYDPSSSTFVNFGTYSDGVWTRLEMEWRESDGTARYRVGDGAWTSWLDFYGGDSFSSFDTINLIKDNRVYSGSGEVYFDDFE